MPNTKTAAKRLKQDKKKHLRNKSNLSAIKTMVKKIRTATVSDTQTAKKLLPKMGKMLDKAQSKGIIHKNKANRTKSRLMKLASKPAQQ